MFRIIFGRGVNLVSFFGSLGSFIFWVALNNGAPTGFLVVPFVLMCIFFVLIYRNILFLDFLDSSGRIQGKVISVQRGTISFSRGRRFHYIRYMVEGLSQDWIESITFSTTKYLPENEKPPKVADEVNMLINRDKKPNLVSEYRLKSMYSLGIDEALSYRELPYKFIYIVLPTLFLLINAIGIYFKYV